MKPTPQRLRYAVLLFAPTRGRELKSTGGLADTEGEEVRPPRWGVS